MANRSLGTLTVDVVAQEGGFAQGMDRVERKAAKTQEAIEREAKRRSKGTEQVWKQATANIEKQFEGMSEAQYRNNMRMVPAQLTDIAVSLQGGQAPLTVLLQQGGQLRDMFGSVGGAARALGTGLMALVSPFSVIASAVAALAAGYLKGEQETSKFRVALETTGHQAGVTVGQLTDMASALDNISGVTQGAASAALVLFATSAGVGADRLERYTATALAWEKATGQAAEEVAKNFKKIADDPLKGIVDLNKEMGFLTSEIYEQVKALQESGRETEAVRVAQDAYEKAAATAAANITHNLGYVERAWRAIKGASAEALDAIASVGRQSGIGQQLAENAVRMAELQAKGVRLVDDLSQVSNYAERDLFNLKQKEIQLQKNLTAERKGAEEQKKAQDTQNDLIALSQEASKYADRETKKRQELAAAEAKYGELAKTNAQAAIRLAQVRAGIEEKYKAPKGAQSQTDKDARAAATFLKNLEDQTLKTQERTAYEKLSNDIALRGLKLTDDQLSRAQGLATAIDMAREAEEMRATALIRSNTEFELQNRLLSQSVEYQAQLSAYGLGDREASVMRERIALIQKHNEEVRKLEHDQANALSGAKSDQEIERLTENFGVRLQLTKDALAQELQAFDDFQAQKVTKERDGVAGVESAMRTYVENSKNAYEQARKGADSILGGMEDALVSFVMTGKASFADFARSVIADLARIAAQQAIAGIAGSLLPAGGLAGGRATGGQVSAGKAYQVNENGPELLTVGGKNLLMMGSQSGSVHNLQTSMSGGAVGGGLTVNVPVSLTVDGGDDPAAARGFGESLARAMKATAQEEIQRASLPGGQLWAMRNGRG